MIYKFIDNNGSEISVNSLSSLQALVDSKTVKENTKVKAGLRGKWTTASNIEELVFIKEDIAEVIVETKPEEVIPEIEPEEVIVETKTEEVIPEIEPEEEKSEYELEEEKRDKTYDDENIIGLNFFDAIKTCLRKYFTINGRASRSEYWFLQLLFAPLSFYVGFWSDPVSAGTMDPPPLYILSTIVVVLLFIPAITSQIRRFHDRDKSGWFILVNFIPIVGWIFVLVMLVEKGTPGKNRFGDYPLKLNR